MPGKRRSARRRQNSKTPPCSSKKTDVDTEKTPTKVTEIVSQDDEGGLYELEMNLKNAQEEYKTVSEKFEKMKDDRRKSKKRDKKNLDIVAVRGMEDVKRKVDKLMRRKVGNLGVSSGSSSSSSDSSSSCSSTDESSSSSTSSDSNNDEKRRKRRNKKKRRSKKHGSGKHRSGKSRKMTS